MSVLHDLRNALAPLALHDDPDVVDCCRRACQHLDAIALDLAAVEGLRARLRDLEQRIAATEDALAVAQAGRGAEEILTSAGLRRDQHGTWWSDAEGEDGLALEIGLTPQALRWVDARGAK